MASRNSSAADWQECERVLDRVAGAVRGVLGSGRVPDQIPALASADPHVFGLAVATAEGEVHGIGEWRRRFSIQSISKVFTLALVIEKDGEALWTRLGTAREVILVARHGRSPEAPLRSCESRA